MRRGRRMNEEGDASNNEGEGEEEDDDDGVEEDEGKGDDRKRKHCGGKEGKTNCIGNEGDPESVNWAD